MDESKKRRSMRPAYLALVGALLLLGAWGFWPRAQDVETATAAYSPLEVGFSEQGKTRLRERYQLSAPIDGVVDRIELEPGDAVAEGATVAVIRPVPGALLDPLSRADAELRLQVARTEAQSAQAGVAAARANRERSASGLRRIEALAARQQVSLDQRDEARRSASAADAALVSAQAQARAAQQREATARTWLRLQGSKDSASARLTVQSPIRGRVMRRQVESEGVVRAGQSLLEVGDPTSIDVVVEVLSADALLLKAGTPVRIDLGDGSRVLAGGVRVIEPSAFTKVSALGVEEQRVVVVVEVPGGLPVQGDGYRVDAWFQVWSAPRVIAAPVPALFRDGEHWAVFVVEDGRARLRRLQVGHVGENLAEVTAGLAPGERVIVYPGDRVRDGERVAYEGR